MRSNRNPSGSATRSVEDRSAGVGGRGVAEGSMVAKLKIPSLPVEWLDSGNWRLPSGKALAEFALQAGFLAPLLLRSDRTLKSGLKQELGAAREKQFGKGDGR
jgi:hypothetical protein